jgi:uncharacterized membrane protein YidH (DUF202 family)
MQNTRLNTLVDVTLARLDEWLKNPWRRTSIQLLAFFLGFVAGQFIASIAGQKANLDVTMAAVFLIIIESYSRLIYQSKREWNKMVFFQTINWFKIGVMYCLFLEAFKLAS